MRRDAAPGPLPDGTPTRAARRQALRTLAALAAAPLVGRVGAASSPARLPIFDAHIHYSHDAWELVPPKQAVQLLRAAGLKGALVSSSNDDGTQMLAAEAPELIVPSLRPYRSRADTGTWVRDDAVQRYLEERLARHRYAAVGEFHLFGADAELPVPRRMVALAREHGLLLHAHSDVDAVERLFRQWPEARVLWAHSGFDRPEAVAEVLERHPRLWCDLAYRGDHAPGGRLEPAWRAAFDAFPDRFMVGTDTFTPERWHYIGPHAEQARQWLATLPPALAEAIAWRNGEAMLRDVRAAGRG
jgi:predicted TIM-barrel fold metal-dependent hydrolase